MELYLHSMHMAITVPNSPQNTLLADHSNHPCPACNHPLAILLSERQISQSSPVKHPRDCCHQKLVGLNRGTSVSHNIGHETAAGRVSTHTGLNGKCHFSSSASSSRGRIFYVICDARPMMGHWQAASPPVCYRWLLVPMRNRLPTSNRAAHDVE